MSADLLFFVSLCKNICLKVKNRLTWSENLNIRNKLW
jgi:hypothetical protein